MPQVRKPAHAHQQVAEVRRVDHEPITELDELVEDRMREGRIARPPHKGRQVVDKQRCHDPREVLRGLAPDREDHLLEADPLVLHGRGDVAVGAYAGIQGVAT